MRILWALVVYTPTNFWDNFVYILKYMVSILATKT